MYNGTLSRIRVLQSLAQFSFDPNFWNFVSSSAGYTQEYKVILISYFKIICNNSSIIIRLKSDIPKLRVQKHKCPKMATKKKKDNT